VQSAIDAIRPIGSIFSIRPPTVIIANVALTIAVAAGTTEAPVQAQVGNAIGAYINGLPIGAALPLTRIAQLAYAANPAITNVSQLLINGSASDITPTIADVIKAGSIAVN
jgi:hypothetical protein